MNRDAIMTNLTSAVQAVEGLVPLVERIGGKSLVGDVANAAGGLLEVAKNVKARFDEGVIVATSNDRTAVDAIIRRLGAVNDTLAKAIADS